VGVHPSTGGREATTTAGHGLAGRVVEAGSGVPPVRLGVWYIDTGRIDGIDVGGEVVITVQAGTALLLLDEAARPEQVLALFDAFRERLGPSATWQSFQLPIDARTEDGLIAVAVPGRLDLVTRRQASSLVADIRLSLAEQDLRWDAEGVPVSVREFA
jgi:hypothetical protein